MKSGIAFEPTGPTLLIAAATTAPSGLQAVHGVSEDCAGYMFYNIGTDTAFVGFGSTAVASKPVIPTAIASKPAYPVKPGDYLFIKAAPNQFVSAIVGTTGGNVFVTPGRFLQL